MSAQVAADLRAAASVLERDGWTQGAYHHGNCHCAEGAIALSVGQHVRAPEDDEDWWENHPDAVLLVGPWFALDEAGMWRRREAAERAVEQYVESRSLADWNDQPQRTADEVIAALRAAAAAAEATS